MINILTIIKMIIAGDQVQLTALWHIECSNKDIFKRSH